MKKGLLVLLLHFAAFSANMLSINFQQKDEMSFLDLLFDAEKVEVEKFHVVDDKQIIIDVKNVDATERVLRAFDTSEFSGSIVFVSAYRKPDTPNDIRVVLQLRDNVRSKLETIGKRTVLTVENRFGAFAQNQVGTKNEIGKKYIAKDSSQKILVPKSDSLEDILENITLSGKKRYIGKKITLNVKSMPVSTVLEMIADASGFNIIQTDDIQSLKPLTLNLINIPWDQVLDTILNLNELVALKNGSILTIKTLKQATSEAQEKAKAKNVKSRDEPLVTKIFPISYAKAQDLNKIVTDYLTKERGTASIDERTNSLIVKDTQTAVEKIKKILEFLDTQTPQVLIESKIVEVFEDYVREIGLQQGVNFGYDPIAPQATSLSGTIGGTSQSTSDFGPGFSFSTAPSTGDGARSLFGLSIGRFGRLFNLNFALQLLESESKGKIVASPRIVTKHNVKAELIAGQETSFAETQGAGDDATVTFSTLSASLKLIVTPLVTNDGSIDLNINLSKQQFGNRPSPNAPPDKSSRDIKTNVLVENGSTIVIGGLYNFEKRESHTGVPFLKDIPLIGWLFRTPYNPQTQKQELVIFMTPRIVNQEKTGITNSI